MSEVGARRASVLGWGLRCALGHDVVDVRRRLAAGESGLRSLDALSPLPDSRGAAVEGPDLRPFLKRRKDEKLLARPAKLLLPAAAEALAMAEAWMAAHSLGAVDRLAVGLYMAVGREPPDEGDSEPALLASMRDGRLDEQLLAGPGRDLYPPLLPLQTLPNMALAHVSIHLGLGGANGTWAGGPETGWAAIVAAVDALHEGRADFVLAGGTDSHVDLGSARDLLRMGITEPPGEAAAVLCLARPELGGLLQLEVPRRRRTSRPSGLGWLGAAEAAVSTVLGLA